MDSMQTYLDVVADRLRPPLVSAPALDSLRRVAAALPPCDLAGLECRLDADPGVDFVVRVPRGAFEVPAPLAAHVAWRDTSAILAALDARGSRLDRLVRVVDLELDLPAPEPLVPSLFFELRREDAPSAEDVAWLASTLAGRPLARATRASLARCVSALPPDGRALHVGAMRARDAEAVRLVVGRVDAAEIGAYLDRAGWSGRREPLAAAVDALAPLADSLCWSLDVGSEVGPRLGVEAFLDRRAGRAAGWRALLDRLVRYGACAPEKAEALLAWSGVTRPRDVPVWPASLRFGERLLGGHAASVFSRFLSHVKLVLDGDAPPRAKAYFGFAHYWVEPEALAERSVRA